MSQQTTNTISTSALWKAIGVLVTVATLIVSITLAFASKTSEDDVRMIIEDKVSYRLNSIDNRLDRIEKKLNGETSR